MSAKTMPDQTQRGGEESINLQAGRDLTVREGLSVEEARSIALDVFRSNFLELRGLAAEVAAERAELITRDFLDELETRAPEALPNTGDPDVQRAIFDAQKEFACSGDEDLEKALVDLLVDRVGNDQRGVRAIVLNEAITAVPKLTAEQRRAVAMSFLVRHTKWVGAPSVDAFYSTFVKEYLLPIATEVPTKDTAYQHIEYVRAGTLSIGELSFANAMQRKAAGLFTRGFARHDAPGPLQEHLDDPRLFIGCIRNPANLQVAVLHDDDIGQLAQSVDAPELEDPLRSVFSLGTMPAAEITEELLSTIPETGTLIECWDGSSLKNLRLTTVGLAIGHGYWRRITGAAAPLDIWVSE